jgi:hypothetical protein
MIIIIFNDDKYKVNFYFINIKLFFVVNLLKDYFFYFSFQNKAMD